MKVKTNVFVNGEHFPEDLEEWLNELKGEGGTLVDVAVVQRPDEPMRVIAYAITDDTHFTVDIKLLGEAQIEAERAHQEVGALVSVILEVHKSAVDPTLTDYAKIAMVKTALARCCQAVEGEGVRVNMAMLLPPQG